MKTCAQVREFHTAFGRPVRDCLTELTPEDRLLRGKLLLEEVMETLIQGLGLRLRINNTPFIEAFETIGLEIHPNRKYDPTETADGLGDINVIIHGTAITMGIDLDAVTTEIHRSNMSKLDENGAPIINGETEGCRAGNLIAGKPAIHEKGFQHDLPIGKILKGPNYFKPDIAKVIGF